MTELSLRATLVEDFRATLTQAPRLDDLVQSMTALQRSGMAKEELRILIERVRAANSASDANPALDEACADALMLLDGAPGGLDWSPAQVAASTVSRLLGALDLDSSLHDALLPSDLLPLVEARESLSRTEAKHYAGLLRENISNFTYRPSPAYFVRAPKSAFTTRPAAVMDVADRVVFEALASNVRKRLDEQLPPSVLWPRPDAAEDEAYASFQTEPTTWEGTHGASADIENFYEYIDHAILARIARSYLGVDSDTSLAIETFLDAIMDSTRGLPQGPLASDTFATLYLLPLDEALVASGWEYVRYQDDYNLAATSYEGAREVLRQVETALREFGLRLSPNKTAIVTRETLIERAQQLETSPYARSQESETPTTLEDLVSAIDRLTSDRSDTVQYRELRGMFDNLTISTFNELPLDAIGKSLNWFPRLAERISRLLSMRRTWASEEVDDFIVDRVTDAPYSDWENAWLCSAFDHGASLTDKSITLLQGISADANVPHMTRYVCVRVLRKRDAITPEAFHQALADLPKAFNADLLLDLGSRGRSGRAELPMGP